MGYNENMTTPAFPTSVTLHLYSYTLGIITMFPKLRKMKDHTSDYQLEEKNDA